MNIPPMSDLWLWLLSKAFDFWEIIILKSAPTLHLIYYAMFETREHIFGLILLLSDGKSLRLDIFGLKRTETKEIHF